MLFSWEKIPTLWKVLGIAGALVVGTATATSLGVRRYDTTVALPLRLETHVATSDSVHRALHARADDLQVKLNLSQDSMFRAMDRLTRAVCAWGSATLEEARRCAGQR